MMNGAKGWGDSISASLSTPINMKKFSIVLPTYNGINTVVRTFDSILNQSLVGVKYEVVVVIDGSNQKLRQIVEDYKKRFEDNAVSFRVKQFKQNRGRFEARISGAKLANFDQLLFVDDRVRLSKKYFEVLQNINKDIAMANVLEVDTEKTNVVSKTLYYLRRKIYGSKFGKDSTDYQINKSNFETLPKGTTSIWITKQVFLDACGQVAHNRKQSKKYVNDDTKILRAIVDKDHNIFRPAKLLVYYQPRDNLGVAIGHLFGRGMRFADYYLKPGTRFFPVLALAYLVPVIIITELLLKPGLLYITLISIIVLVALTALAISRSLKEFAISLAGLSLIGLVFTLGIWKSAILTVKETLFNR